jgi:hypothetical protein
MGTKSLSPPFPIMGVTSLSVPFPIMGITSLSPPFSVMGIITSFPLRESLFPPFPITGITSFFRLSYNGNHFFFPAFSITVSQPASKRVYFFLAEHILKTVVLSFIRAQTFHFYGAQELFARNLFREPRQPEPEFINF